MPNEGFGDGRISLAAHIKELMSVNDRMNAHRYDGLAEGNKAIIAMLKEVQKAIQNEIDGLDGRMRKVETTTAEHSERWKGHVTEHKKENRIMMVISGIGSAIAGFLGIAVKTP